MVFQQFNLFPHLTVLENLTLAPIWAKQVPKREADELAMQLLARVRIPGRRTNTRHSCPRPAAARGDRARARDEPKVMLFDSRRPRLIPR